MSNPNLFPFQESLKENNFNSNLQEKEEEDNQNSKESNISNNNIESKNIELNFMDNLDIPKMKQLNSKCVEFIFEEKTDIALEILKKLEIFLESNLIESKFNFDKKFIIIILHNLACSYQKLKDYENCITYLDGVIYHFDKELENKHQIKINEEYFYQNISKDQSNNSLLGDLILELRFSAKFHLQMCAVLSQANRHIEALNHAKLAGLICEDNIIKTYYLFLQMKLKNIFSLEDKNNNNNNDIEKNEEDELKNNEKMKLIQKIINDLFYRITNLRKNIYNKIDNNIYFNSYLNYRKNEIHKYQKNTILLNNIRNVFGGEIKNDDWIQLLNIGNIMYLSPLNDEDLDLESDPKYELLRDAILEKVVMLTVSFFCIATEMKQLSTDKNNKKINGEFFHYQAVAFSNLYLPVSCPIVKHYISSYYKYYEKDLEIIPEGKIIDYKIDIIKNEIEFNKDVQSFVRMKKINYSINTNEINVLNKNNFNLENSNKNCNNVAKKNKILLSLNLNLNLENILNKKNNNEGNINKGNNSKNKNNKLSSSNDNKHLNDSNNNKNYNLINKENDGNYIIVQNKINLDIAEKSKIKELPKFKLNFNNLNNSSEENISKDKVINEKYNIIKKIRKKISVDNKTNRDSSSNNKIKKNNFNKRKGYKTDRPISNKRPINIKETSVIKKEKNSWKLDLKKISFNKSFYSNFLSKTYRNHKKKSPTIDNKGKIKGNLTDRAVANKNKSIKRSEEKKIKNNCYKNNIGHLTQRELSHSKLNEKISLHNDNISIIKNNKNDNIKTLKQIKSSITFKNNKCNKSKNKDGEQKKLIKKNNINNNEIKIKSKMNDNKIKNYKNDLIEKLYNNILYIKLKNKNKNYFDKRCGKSQQINNFNSLIKIKNPFKS